MGNNTKLSIPSHFLNLQQEHDHDQQQKQQQQQQQHQQQEQDDDMYDDTEQHIAERLAAAALDDDDDVVDDTILNDNIHETNVDQNVNNNGINGINDTNEVQEEKKVEFLENNPQIETTSALEMNDTNQHKYSPHTQILKRPLLSKRNDYEKQFNSNRIIGNNNINTQKIPSSSKIDNDTPNINSMITSTTTAKTSTNKTADIIGSLPAQEVSISSMTTIKQIKQRSSDNNNDTSNSIHNSTNKLSKVASEKSMTETDANTGSC